MTYRWLLRAAKWARNPPSKKQMMIVGTILVACILLYAIEHLVGWPDWAKTPTRMRF